MTRTRVSRFQSKRKGPPPGRRQSSSGWKPVSRPRRRRNRPGRGSRHSWTGWSGRGGARSGWSARDLAKNGPFRPSPLGSVNPPTNARPPTRYRPLQMLRRRLVDLSIAATEQTDAARDTTTTGTRGRWKTVFSPEAPIHASSGQPSSSYSSSSPSYRQPGHNISFQVPTQLCRRKESLKGKGAKGRH